MNIIENLKVKYILYKNKKALKKLERSLEEYRNHSKILLDSLDDDVKWNSGIAEEEIILSKCETIILRRISRLES